MENINKKKDEELLIMGLLGTFDRTKKKNDVKKSKYNIGLDLFMILITAGLWIFWIIYRSKKI